MRIAYVGLGAMGLPFATHLAKAGHDLLGWDVDDASRARAATRRLALAESLQGVVDHAEILFTCLPSPAAVEAVYANVTRDGLVACDNSTVGPALAKRLQAELGARGVGYVECPMLGGVHEAEAGSLFLLLSGKSAHVDRVLPMARVAAHDHRVVGAPGQASLFKTVQNGLGHVQATAIAEALALVAAAGGDIDRFIDVVGDGGGMASTNLFRAKAPMMRDPLMPAVGTLYIAAKDAGLAAALAKEVDHEAPMFHRSAAVYQEAMAKELGHEDMAAIARVIEGQTGARIAKD